LLAVVLFLGAVTQGEPLLILNEYLPGGNLVRALTLVLRASTSM
jgi:hypothetical protein